jgi:hypothetical protein
MDMVELARRAVACRRWRWMPGMIDDTFERILNVYHVGPSSFSYLVADGEGRTFETATMPGLPFFEDPATLGWLLALVREAWGTFGVACTAHDGGSWSCFIPGAICEEMVSEGATECEALVAALEAAP